MRASQNRSRRHWGCMTMCFYLAVTDTAFSCVEVECSCWTSMRCRYIARTTIQQKYMILNTLHFLHFIWNSYMWFLKGAKIMSPFILKSDLSIFLNAQRYTSQEFRRFLMTYKWPEGHSKQSWWEKYFPPEHWSRSVSWLTRRSALPSDDSYTNKLT